MNNEDQPMDLVGITSPIVLKSQGESNDEKMKQMLLSMGFRPVPMNNRLIQGEIIVQPMATQEQLDALSTTLSEFRRVKFDGS